MHVLSGQLLFVDWSDVATFVPVFARVAATLISVVADLPAGPFLVVCFSVSAVATRLPCRRKKLSGGGDDPRPAAFP